MSFEDLVARGSALALFALTVACGAAPLDEAWTSPATAACAPADGVLRADELRLAPGTRARVRVGAGPIEVDVSSRADDAAGVWDLSRPDASKQPAGLLEVVEPGALSLAAGAGEVDAAASLAPDGSLWSLLRVDEDAVRIVGAVSSDGVPADARNRLLYDDPPALHPLPLEVGSRSVTASTAGDVLIDGAPNTVVDTWDAEVTGAGTLLLPDLELTGVLRLTLRFERAHLFGDARQVTHVFLHECLGEVARVRGPLTGADEAFEDDFGLATEIWRLAL
jgi:hypothetical protein